MLMMRLMLSSQLPLGRSFDEEGVPFAAPMLMRDFLVAGAGESSAEVERLVVRDFLAEEAAAFVGGPPMRSWYSFSFTEAVLL